MHDPRAKQALYMAKGSPKSSMGRGSGRAIMFVVMTAAAIGAAIWLLFSMV